MKRFFLDVSRGYMMIAEPFNECWSYLFICEWRRSTRDALQAVTLLAILILITPFAYLCVAPFVAVLEGLREEGE